MNWFAGSTVQVEKGRTWVHALQNISVDLKPGDRLGLVGHNGSGKSTLLRLLAGLAHPDKGVLRIDGRVAALIDRNLGINAELTGRANIELPLRLLGATEQEIIDAKESIPDWTGLGPFIDLAMRTYSDGMKARLMFAISTSLHSDILLLDEWLGVTDADFMARAEQRLVSMLDRTAIVVVASHSTEILHRFCTKICWMERGQILAMGEPNDVLEKYLGRNQADPAELLTLVPGTVAHNM